MKRKTDGELDDQRIAEGLSGESTIFRRRGSDKPEAGRPQMHPKRIRFVVDVSASMYRCVGLKTCRVCAASQAASWRFVGREHTDSCSFQYDGRMDRSLEAVVLIMEAFARVARPDKYVFDIVGHSGDGPEISLVTTDAPPKDARERCASPSRCGASDARRQSLGQDVASLADGCVNMMPITTCWETRPRGFTL